MKRVASSTLSGVERASERATVGLVSGAGDSDENKGGQIVAIRTIYALVSLKSYG